MSTLAMSCTAHTCLCLRSSQAPGLSPSQINALPSFTFTPTGNLSAENLSCSICMDEFAPGAELRLLPCLHRYCTGLYSCFEFVVVVCVVVCVSRVIFFCQHSTKYYTCCFHCFTPDITRRVLTPGCNVPQNAACAKCLPACQLVVAGISLQNEDSSAFGMARADTLRIVFGCRRTLDLGHLTHSQSPPFRSMRRMGLIAYFMVQVLYKVM